MAVVGPQLAPQPAQVQNRVDPCRPTGSPIIARISRPNHHRQGITTSRAEPRTSSTPSAKKRHSSTIPKAWILRSLVVSLPGEGDRAWNADWPPFLPLT
jgi:hypothetical protein